jgi:hypothetical protein
MTHRLFRIGSTVSWVLFVGVVLLWGRACVVSDEICFNAGGRSIELRSFNTFNGTLYVAWTSRWYGAPRWETYRGPAREPWARFFRPEHYVWTDVMGQPHFYNWLGFALQPTYLQPAYAGSAECWFTRIGIPFYALFVLTAAMPAIRVVQWRRRRARKSRGLCPACAYDLRASTDRCPECGTTIPATS